MLGPIKNTKRGFSLIELLVVIAIIGILSGIVLASLTSSREKSRDGKRVAEITEATKALELYFDIYKTYPSTTPENVIFANAGCASPSPGTDVALQLLRCRKLFSQTPIPPPSGGPTARYIYKGVKSGAECYVSTVYSGVDYALGISLERSDYSVLKSDVDQIVVSSFYGNSKDCAVVADSNPERYYDVKP